MPLFYKLLFYICQMVVSNNSGHLYGIVNNFLFIQFFFKINVPCTCVLLSVQKKKTQKVKKRAYDLLACKRQI